jgi:hypothetical protein
MDYLETIKRFMFALNVRNIGVYNKQANKHQGRLCMKSTKYSTARIMTYEEREK